ncbi:uncharacterized protein EI90DRAFT_3291118 [Cantharellus anzutake]|uniref:uncharacterized protein n=1 Tax=Cantharellus anzutake TaxID=1750568 RepID=UPI0019039F6A|nr:uncharacterized protein EI90DRAFT_3291118 [Cantharellus anzutake]KAF8327289.1 hypothetical protein EI90DRAFT_3291118 [Cantharellus anzutake]
MMILRIIPSNRTGLTTMDSASLSIGLGEGKKEWCPSVTNLEALMGSPIPSWFSCFPNAPGCITIQERIRAILAAAWACNKGARERDHQRGHMQTGTPHKELLATYCRFFYVRSTSLLHWINRVVQVTIDMCLLTLCDRVEGIGGLGPCVPPIPPSRLPCPPLSLLRNAPAVRKRTASVFFQRPLAKLAAMPTASPAAVPGAPVANYHYPSSPCIGTRA